MSVALHDGLLVDRVSDDMNEEINRMAADFTMQM